MKASFQSIRLYLISIAVLMTGFVHGQKYLSNWVEDGHSNKIDSIRIEVKGKKITFVVPRDNGSILIFEAKLDTDLNAVEQDMKAYLKSIHSNIDVNFDYKQTLKDHPPRLVCGVKEGDKTIEFSRNQIRFYAPAIEDPLFTPQRGYDYIPKNTFNVIKTWETEAGPFSFRSMLDSDTNPLIAFFCGLLDGLLEDLKMVVSIGKFIDDNTIYVFGDAHVIDLVVENYDESFMDRFGILLPKEFSAEHRKARAALRTTFKKMVEYMDNYEELKKLGTMVYDALGDALSEWFDETIGNNTPALQGYQSGKLVYGLITSLIGIKELSIMLQGTTQLAKSLKILKNMACFPGDEVLITNRGVVSFESLKLGPAEFIQLNDH